MSTTVRPEDVLTDINGSLQIRGSADLARELVRAAIELERVPAFLEAAGRALFRSPLRVERLFVSIKALHPAVLAIRQRLAAFNDARARASQMPLRHSLCLHYGRILYGNIGSSDRFNFTIIGDAVNLTARAVDAQRSLGLSISSRRHLWNGSVGRV